MERPDLYDVAIAGAGPAAWIAGDGLSRAGQRVVILGPPARSPHQGAHVHLFSAALWPRLFALLPRLEPVLRERGIPFVPPGAFVLDETIDDGARVPALSRRMLDDVVRRSVLGSQVEFHHGRLRQASHDRGGWRIRTTAGACLRASWLVDATGTARASARAAGAAIGAPLPLDEADVEFRYASWRLSGVRLPPGRVGHRCWCPATRTGALLAPGGDGAWQMTLQMAGGGRDRIPATPFRLLARFDDDRLARACAGASVVGGPHHWTCSSVTRMAVEPAANKGVRWFALGDALITTPAVLGWGFEQIVEQCEGLAEAFSTGGFAEVFQRLETTSRRRFHQAVLAAARRSGLLEAVPAAPVWLQTQGSDHVESAV